MFGLKRKQNMTRDVAKNVKRLEQKSFAFVECARRAGMGGGQLTDLVSSLRGLQSATSDLLSEASYQGYSDPESISMFMSALGGFRGSLIERKPRASADCEAFFAEAFEIVKRLGGLGRVLLASSIKDNELRGGMSPDEYAWFTKLHREIAGIDKQLAREVSLSQLERWLAKLPILVDIYYEEANVNQLARLFALYQEPFQTWEIRYRSKLPGRRLVRLLFTTEFPGPEMLEQFDPNYDPRREYFIAATVPKWCVVWKYN